MTCCLSVAFFATAIAFSDWLRSVPAGPVYASTTLHGPDCEAIFFRALADYSYGLSRTGELTVCSDLRIRS
jgi:hypothetical protein